MSRRDGGLVARRQLLWTGWSVYLRAGSEMGSAHVDRTIEQFLLLINNNKKNT